MAIFVSGGFWAAEHFIEELTLDDRLSAEMDRFVDSNTESLNPDLLNPQLRYYRRPASASAALPADLSSLEAGIYRREDAQGREETVLVRALDDGGLAILVFVDEEASHRRHWLAISIVLSTALAGLLSFWMAGRLASQTLAPLDDMVRTLTALDPEKRGERMPAADLDSELNVITEALNGYMSRLDEVVNRERAFAKAASHELRTPLAIIQSSAEVLVEQGIATPHLDRILKAAQNASRDLDTLLWLSRSTGQAPQEPLALHEILVSLCAGQIDVSKIAWSLQPCEVTASPGAVAVIVTNLLRNALKASPQPGSVRVHLTAQALTVRDEGPGLPANFEHSIFQPGVSFTDGGSGMGLYIASVLSTRLGWQLRLSNGERVGADAELRF